jgi:hypothetical protein
MALTFGTVSNLFYAVVLGTVVLNLVYIAAGVSAISLLLPK